MPTALLLLYKARGISVFDISRLKYVSCERLPKSNSITYMSATRQFLPPFPLSSVPLQHAIVLPSALLLIHSLLLLLIQEPPFPSRALSHIHTWQLAGEDNPFCQLLPTQHGGGLQVQQHTVIDLTGPNNPPITQFENPNYPLHFDELGPIFRCTPLQGYIPGHRPKLFPSRKATTHWKGC
jgi:hypothetical protein